MDDKLRQIIEEFIAELTALLESAKEEGHIVVEAEKPSSENGLTRRTLLELVYHEGIVLEAYKDSKGIWTWGIGVTNASGHRVYPRYKDEPQTLKKVVEVFEWLVRTKYLPDVLEAFKGFDLTEEQLAAAVSFHYNTGGIGRASWVQSFKEGKISKARQQFLNWRSPPEIIPRREAERDLFFDGVWTNDGTSTLYDVRKPAYTPRWSSARRVDISQELS